MDWVTKVHYWMENTLSRGISIIAEGGQSPHTTLPMTQRLSDRSTNAVPEFVANKSIRSARGADDDLLCNVFVISLAKLCGPGRMRVCRWHFSIFTSSEKLQPEKRTVFLINWCPLFNLFKSRGCSIESVGLLWMSFVHSFKPRN